MQLSRRTFLKQASVAAALACARPQSYAEEAPLLEEFDYGSVTLAPGLARSQFEHTQSVLLQMDIDGMLRPWRARAGLPSPGPDLGGWYDSDGKGFAPGHALGQWLSALARGFAVDHDPAKNAKVSRVLELYAPSISPKFYSNFRFPAYNFDKLVCGLNDAHALCGLDRDFSLLGRITDAAVAHLPPSALDRDEPQLRWRASKGENISQDFGWDEPYTLPENLFLAARLGAGDRYRKLAAQYLWDTTYFDPLASGKNVLAGHHAYSSCNALSSAVQAYLTLGSQKHLAAARNAFDMITAQSFATGGWGPDEQFRAPDSDDLYLSLGKTHSSFETPCGAYGHFKLTRYLLRITQDGRYGDSMERVLYNTVLGSRPLQKDGTAFYYSDYNYQGKKTYHKDKWPCCSGTLPQVAADYHKLIYFRDPHGIFVNLYLPSELRWTATDGAQVKLVQSGGYPENDVVRIEVHSNRQSRFALRVRIPAWTEGASTLRVNGAPAKFNVINGFGAIERVWKHGDAIELTFPMTMRLEAIDRRHGDTVALLRGPLVLFALGDVPHVSREELLKASGRNGSWQVRGVRLVPFTAINDEAYTTYRKIT